MGTSQQRPRLDDPPPSTPDAFCAIIWAVSLICCHLTWGRKAIMSRDRQRPLEAEGSWWGNQDQELPPEPASSSQAALLTLDRAGGTFGGQPSCPQPRALPGFPCSQPCLLLGPGPFGWLRFLPGAEGSQPWRLHISHRDSIGPLGLDWGLGGDRDGDRCLWYTLGWGPPHLQAPVVEP